jgi:ABC-type transport system involved in multi-copper enzyme maturation permease subunit
VSAIDAGTASAHAPVPRARAAGIGLWLRQALGAARLDLSTGFAGWRSLWLMFLAFGPVFILTLHVLKDRNCALQEDTLVLAGILQLYYLRFAIFFGCLGVFVRLIRGGMVERTMHYALLAPVRREVLVAGKFAAGAFGTICLFSAGVLACFALVYVHIPGGAAFVWNGGGLAHLQAYLLMTALACLGYGAVFLAVSLLFRNPILPAIAVLLWEGINGVLPAWLQHFSVTFYLKPLRPVALPIDAWALFMVVTEPTAPWLCVVGLVVFAGLALALACWRVRRMEISYSVD